MQDIEKHNVAGELRDRFSDIVKTKIDVAVMAGRDLRAVSDLAGIRIQPEDWLRTSAFPQIKGEQSHAAAHIQNRRRGGTQQVVGTLVNPVAAQFATDVVAQPALRKPSRYPRTRIFVVGRVSSRGFHLRRIIALPD